LIALSVEGGHISLVYPRWGINSTFAKRYTAKTTSYGVELSSRNARHNSSWVARRARCFVTVDQDCSLHIAKFNIFAKFFLTGSDWRRRRAQRAESGPSEALMREMPRFSS